MAARPEGVGGGGRFAYLHQAVRAAVQAGEDVVAGLGARGEAVGCWVHDVEGGAGDFFVPFFCAEFWGSGFGVGVGG